MVIWINGAFGAGKTTTAYELHRRLNNSFVYDPENVGYFIRKNAPKEFSGGDFQDIPLWRKMNYEMLKMISGKYGGTIIVPMTLVNKEYYDEIIGALRRDGIELRHFILYASREESFRRIKKRSLHRDSFAVGSVERCVTAFDSVITEEKIDTENTGINEAVEELARRCGLALAPDKKTKAGRFFYRLGVQLKHIR